MKSNRTEGKSVVYLDETWANALDGKNKIFNNKFVCLAMNEMDFP